VKLSEDDDRQFKAVEISPRLFAIL